MLYLQHHYNGGARITIVSLAKNKGRQMKNEINSQGLGTLSIIGFGILE